jgi:hypothetical protein
MALLTPREGHTTEGVTPTANKQFHGRSSNEVQKPTTGCFKEGGYQERGYVELKARCNTKRPSPGDKYCETRHKQGQGEAGRGNVTKT